ncbi:type II toxin-antitoxin system Phd/YefM family antitoxin [Rhizobium sp. AU243]|uniref:type II toxin-antitoxin system Phd/YefM family antitoxin n=1 Tax=Rhizobium sp. AU243 TaxID=2303425 RepID=UPI0010CB7312|nr:type II toxin-antitoxin system Phd/YefM family antitoxin [Rhizobium sp. AU243]TKV77073.1 type II toxin-antitoxin system Phd/YefM family antitoxin [Rhizobium sp. AU243]
MKTMSARDAKNAFGLLLDTARAQPVAVEKHGRAVVVVISVEEFERMKRRELRISGNEISNGRSARVQDHER